jgi:histidyl-tRNA synthetase
MHETRRGLVTPQTLKGFQDLLPPQMIARDTVIEKIKRIYEKYGFVPIDTPVLEYLSTLVGTGGEETNKTLFKLDSPEKEPIAMRFDLTVPFARLIAQYPEELRLPFRRYHVGPAFRADKPGPGRYRQFTQFDIDAAGSTSVAVDAEIIAAMCEIMTEVGLDNTDASHREFIIRINNRKLVDAVLEGCGIADREVQKHVLRVVDKLQKAGLENVRKELGPGRVDESGDPIRGVGLSPRDIDKIVAFISITGGTREEVVDSLAKLLPSSPTSETALQEMRDLASALTSLRVNETDAIFDPSLARGLDYYTGPVFEAFLPIAPDFGSIMGGGRYDELVERFLETEIPATGASIGVDRFMAALLQTGKLQVVATTTRVLVLSMSGTPIAELLKAAADLRAVNIATEVYYGKPDDGFRKQLSFANSRQIPIAVILGEDELSKGQVSVKNLVVGKEKRADIQDREQYVGAGKVGQVTVDRNQLVEAVQEMMGQAP